MQNQHIYDVSSQYITIKASLHLTSVTSASQNLGVRVQIYALIYAMRLGTLRSLLSGLLLTLYMHILYLESQSDRPIVLTDSIELRLAVSTLSHAF